MDKPPKPFTLNPAPIVLLDKPQMGENIGAVARAMMNFGMSELRLVNPRDGWPNPKAHEMSANADWIIEAATVYSTFAEALADCHYAIASTARQRDMTIESYAPSEAAAILAQRARAGEKAAIILGGERSGLANEDIAHCQAVCTIPTDPRMSSLNLAQSMVILGYEWWLAREGIGEVSPSPLRGRLGGGGPLHSPHMCRDGYPRPNFSPQGGGSASHAERQALYAHLIESLTEKGYYQHEGKASAMQRNLRCLIARLPLSSQQIQSLRGMIRALVN